MTETNLGYFNFGNKKRGTHVPRNLSALSKIDLARITSHTPVILKPSFT